MAHNGLFKFPWQRLFFVSGGCFPARESARYIFGIEGAKKLLHDRQTVLIFPEGKRVLYNTAKPYDGISILVSEVDSYIVPINLEWKRKKKYFQGCSIITGKPQPAAGKKAQDIMDIIYKMRETRNA
jgi:1-acyl-sn-glycerol-3-phosphate acyltransferase